MPLPCCWNDVNAAFMSYEEGSCGVAALDWLVAQA
jgi:hypothetical protein